MHSTADLLGHADVARRLGISEGTLRNWRSDGKGPRWAINPDTGRFIGYTPQAVEEWLRRAVEGTTPEDDR